MWQVKIHSLVLEEDFRKINHHDQALILKTIYKKLSLSPQEYGEKLKYGLKGYWKLKISHYRVIYRIENDKILVLVLKIDLRRDQEVYREMLSHLNRPQSI